MNIMRDGLADGTTFRVMTLIDPYSRECLAAVACRSFSGADVASVLVVVSIDRGVLPNKIRVDNGTEFTSKALDHWAYWNHVELDYSRPGKPAESAFIEAFNGTLRRECLSQHWFTDLDEAQGVLCHWRDDYNNHRPDSAFAARPPALLRGPRS
jgi:putative transposase